MRPTNKNTLLKVVILGDGGVGKSCLMNRFVSNQFDEHSFHTIGVEFLNKDIEIDGETYTLQVSIHPPVAPLYIETCRFGTRRDRSVSRHSERPSTEAATSAY
jgi:GTPase SAR1 family protein